MYGPTFVSSSEKCGTSSVLSSMRTNQAACRLQEPSKTAPIQSSPATRAQPCPARRSSAALSSQLASIQRQRRCRSSGREEHPCEREGDGRRRGEGRRRNSHHRRASRPTEFQNTCGRAKAVFLRSRHCDAIMHNLWSVGSPAWSSRKRRNFSNKTGPPNPPTSRA